MKKVVYNGKEYYAQFLNSIGFANLYLTNDENGDFICVDIDKITSNTIFSEITTSLAKLLEAKNAKYGNAALEPLDIFTGKCKVGQRLDDKLARVKNSQELRKNDIADIMGYLVLTCVEKGLTNFDDLID